MNCSLRRFATLVAIWCVLLFGSAENSLAGDSSLVHGTESYIGTNPTSMRSNWCARFANMVLQRTGYQGTNSDSASSFMRLKRVRPTPGAIAITRGTGDSGLHIALYKGVDANGNPILVGGNQGKRVDGRRRVSEVVFPKGYIVKYVNPQ